MTSYEDLRIRRTLASLAKQETEPASVIVTDGSRDAELAGAIRGLADQHGAEWVHEDGASVARSRNLALEAVGDDIEALAFLDTDQRAPPHWLGTLVEGLVDGDHGWVGGPTRVHAKVRLLFLKEERLYAAARHDATRIPMGNSLWRREVFEEVGGFDERLSRGGEDWDLALRAADAGYTGAVIEDAWVHHDLTHVDSVEDILRKQFRYDVGGAMAYIKNRRLADRVRSRQPNLHFHWTDVVSPFSKVAALPVAWWRLRDE